MKKICTYLLVFISIIILSACSSDSLERTVEQGQLYVAPPVNQSGEEIEDASLTIKNLDTEIADKNWGLREIETGTYIVRISGDDYFNYGQIVEVKEGEVTTIEAELEELDEFKQAISNVTDGGFKVFESGSWSEDFLAKGINLGMAKPNHFPGEAAITKSEYESWIEKIGDMNANIIRVYTIHPPGFYEALAEYNRGDDEPIYLLHGAWIEEETLVETEDAFDERNTTPFQEEIKDIIDVIHGQAIIEDEPGHAGGVYEEDISDYVLGYIIGIEWEASMVDDTNTNEKNEGMSDFTGEFFETKAAEPFEIWLAEQMEEAVSYEENKYNKYRSISFSNWVTTDAIPTSEKDYEPAKEERLVSIRADNIEPQDEFKAGYFASYHAYPYYPESLNYDSDYINYQDHRGEENAYAGYLNHLQEVHDIPVLIAEFGVPSSRGRGHTNTQGKHEGGLSEEEQGQINKELFEDIVAEEMMGGLLFTWQDEFFKRTWNNQAYNNPDRRPFWSNIQTNEQFYGVFDFDVRAKNMNGDFSQWNDDELFYQSQAEEYFDSFYVSSDAESLYFKLVLQENINLAEDETYILLNTNFEQGRTLFDRNNIDFIVKLADGQARVLVEQDYDVFEDEHAYGEYSEGEEISDKEYDFISEEIGEFNPIRRILNNKFEIPATEEIIYFAYEEAGKLSTTEEDNEYNSLTDLAIKNNKLELRISWGLLNFRDSSQREIIADLDKGLDSSKITEGIKLYLVTKQDNSNIFLPKDKNEAEIYTWKQWNKVNYQERKKESYGIMQKLWTD